MTTSDYFKNMTPEAYARRQAAHAVMALALGVDVEISCHPQAHGEHWTARCPVPELSSIADDFADRLMSLAGPVVVGWDVEDPDVRHVMADADGNTIIGIAATAWAVVSGNEELLDSIEQGLLGTVGHLSASQLRALADAYDPAFYGFVTHPRSVVPHWVPGSKPVLGYGDFDRHQALAVAPTVKPVLGVVS